MTPTRLRLVIWHRTPTGELVKTTGNWNFREGLRHWMELYRASLLPGGTKEYVSQYLGFAPLPFEAMVLDGLRVVEQWSAGTITCERYRD